VRIWLYRVPSLIGAIGAVLLTYWTALAFCDPAAGALRRADDLQLRAASGGEARLAKTDAMLSAHRHRGDGGDGAGVFVLAAARGSGHPPLVVARDLLDRTGRRHPAQGAA